MPPYREYGNSADGSTLAMRSRATSTSYGNVILMFHSSPGMQRVGKPEYRAMHAAVSVPTNPSAAACSYAASSGAAR